MLISNFSTLTFDCYGTLIDWETGIANALMSSFAQSDLSLDRSTLLDAFAKNECVVQSEQPDLAYRALLEQTHRKIAEQLNVSVSEDVHRTFAESIENWPAFADSVKSLKYLKQYFNLVILSNVDRAGFAKSNQHLKVEFDAVYTAEDIGSYKPDHRNFHHMLSELESRGIQVSEILHTAQSQFHDMIPATALGLKTCWIDRRAGETGSGATPSIAKSVKTDFRFESLENMVAAHKIELGLIH